MICLYSSCRSPLLDKAQNIKNNEELNNSPGSFFHFEDIIVFCYSSCYLELKFIVDSENSKETIIR